MGVCELHRIEEVEMCEFRQRSDRSSGVRHTHLHLQLEISTAINVEIGDSSRCIASDPLHTVSNLSPSVICINN